MEDNQKSPQETEKLHERIKRLREDKGWTQNEVAKKIGYALATYQKWEQEAGATPGMGGIIALAELYGLSTDYIKEGLRTKYIKGGNPASDITNKEISEIIGLSEKSVETLRKLNTGSNDEEAIHLNDAVYFNRKAMEIIDFVLEDSFDTQIKNRFRQDDEPAWPVYNIFRAMYEYFSYRDVIEHDCSAEEFNKHIINIWYGDWDIDDNPTKEEVIVGYLESCLQHELRVVREKYQKMLDKEKSSEEAE